MGIARGTVGLLLHEATSRPFGGTLLTLGRQHIYVTESELRLEAERHRVALRQVDISLHANPSLAGHGYISDDSFFRLLGFDQIERADVSDYEDVEHLLDLNAGEVDNNLRGRFDVVLDTGTMEHVFDVPACLRTLIGLTRTGGRVIHMNPASNMVEHGFYSFSPTFYADYYSANRWQVHALYLIRCGRVLERSRFDVFECRSDRRALLTGGRLDKRIHLSWCVAEKRAESTSNVTPQQGAYLTTWSAAGDTTNEQDRTAARDESVSLRTPALVTHAVRLAKKVPGTKSIVSRVGALLLNRSWKPTPLDRVGRF